MMLLRLDEMLRGGGHGPTCLRFKQGDVILYQSFRRLKFVLTVDGVRRPMLIAAVD
jgi:hypothetical protein